MHWVAWKMLTGDRAKYFGTVFGVAFGVLLISQQTSIFVSLMRRTAHAVLDLRDADLWVMDPFNQNADEIKPLSDTDVFRVRGVPGVKWAVPLYKSLARAKTETGHFRQVVLMGLDDYTLVGAPATLLHGNLADIRRDDAVIVDKPGYDYLFPGEPIRLFRELEMNDRRAVIVGVCECMAPFQTFPVVYTRYSQALGFGSKERNQLSFVLTKVDDGLDLQTVCDRIKEQTGLEAQTRQQFIWTVVGYFMRSTGIPVNFGITIALGFIVGTAIAGQTFYLFTLENLKQFGALKAMGVSNLRIIAMVLLQSAVVGTIGFGLGIGMASAFFEATKDFPHLAGFYMPWQVVLLSLGAVVMISVLSSAVSLRKVLVLEPAVVFR